MYSIRTRSGVEVAHLDDLLLALRVLRLCTTERDEPLALYRDKVKLAWTTNGMKAHDAE